jgi:hypothetical protein
MPAVPTPSNLEARKGAKETSVERIIHPLMAVRRKTVKNTCRMSEMYTISMRRKKPEAREGKKTNCEGALYALDDVILVHCGRSPQSVPQKNVCVCTCYMLCSSFSLVLGNKHKGQLVMIYFVGAKDMNSFFPDMCTSSLNPCCA